MLKVRTVDYLCEFKLRHAAKPSNIFKSVYFLKSAKTSYSQSKSVAVMRVLLGVLL